MHSSQPIQPTVESAVAAVVEAARQQTLFLIERAGIPARQLGYGFEDVCNGILEGEFRLLRVEPHQNRPGKFVLKGVLYCFPPEGEIEDALYVKFVLGETIVCMSWKRDNASP